ncbi:hypothetical protein [Flavobacterium sp.]|uniref:hypothetical protein n=1 Tax=Flavobacterium sp. TaxID=239 RepID=UPI002FDE450A
MSEFKEIIDYLRFFRRTEDTEEKNKFRAAIKVDEDYVNATIIDENDLIFVEKEAIVQQNGYKFVAGEIIGNLFLINQTSSIKEYYIKREDDTSSDAISWYKRIPYEFSNAWVEKEDVLLVEIEINQVSNFYYDYQNATIIEVFLEDTFVFPDYFVYHPKDITISSDSSFSFNFKDEEGYTTDNSDRFLRVLFSSNLNVLISEAKRIVTFYKSEKPGYVYLLPKIKTSLNRYILDYNYYQRGIPFNRSINNPAITLSFKSIGAMAEFLNQTLFYELNTIDQFINDDESTFSARELFLEDYVQLITSEIAFGGSDKVLEILYYVPVFLFQKIDTNLLWSIIDNTLEGRVTNAGLNKEDIVLHILESILSSSINENIFLLELLKENRSKKTRFALLYEKMNGDNFVSLTTFIYNTWLKSSFVEIDNNFFKNSNGPLNLPYKSEKFAGFFSSNKNFNFLKNNQILVSEDESWIDNVISFFDPELGEWVEQLVEEQNKYIYHYYQPILLANIEQESAIALPKLLPAYFLKANEDKAFWSNIITSLEYTVDVVTTLSGIGNIAKFRHLANMAKVASRFSKYQKASKFASTISKIRLAVGAIEISSGSLNILLKLTELRETSFGQSLTEYLFYLELLSLSGELTAAIKNGLRKSAKKLVKHEDEIRKVSKKEGIEDVDGLLDELYEVAEIERKLGDFVMHSGDNIFENYIKGIVKQVRESTGLNNFDIHLIDRNNEKYKKLFDQWQKGGGHGFFKPTSGEFGIKLYKGLFGEGPQIYMFAGKTIDEWGVAKNVFFTKYTTQHELFHVEMFMYLKKKTPNYMKYWAEIPTHMHEQYVLNRLLKTKKWKKEDLLSDLYNINTIRKKYNPKLGDITLRELESWKFEIELEKIGIKIQ